MLTSSLRPQGLIVNEGEEPAWRFVSDIQDVLRIQTDRLYNEADCTGIHGARRCCSFAAPSTVLKQSQLSIGTSLLHKPSRCFYVWRCPLTPPAGDWVDLTASASADACVTIVYWIDVHLGGDAVLSNEPPGASQAAPWYLAPAFLCTGVSLLSVIALPWVDSAAHAPTVLLRPTPIHSLRRSPRRCRRRAWELGRAMGSAACGICTATR